MHDLECLSDCTTFVIAQFTTFCLRIMTFQLPLFWITLYMYVYHSEVYKVYSCIILNCKQTLLVTRPMVKSKRQKWLFYLYGVCPLSRADGPLWSVGLLG